MLENHALTEQFWL